MLFIQVLFVLNIVVDIFELNSYITKLTILLTWYFGRNGQITILIINIKFLTLVKKKILWYTRT